LQLPSREPVINRTTPVRFQAISIGLRDEIDCNFIRTTSPGATFSPPMNGIPGGAM